jgi:DNA adenine methylase
VGEPFIKWAGGKRRFAASVMPSLLPRDFEARTYVEPMVGGGAAFYAHGRRAPSAVLADVNARLISAYTGVRDDPFGVLDLIEEMPVGKDEYLEFRDEFNARPEDPVRMAALFIYLNRTCFNGVYRENAKGKFNVPYGDVQQIGIGMVRSKVTAASEVLQGVELRHSPLKKLLSWCPEGAFVFFDPPYVTKGEFEAGGGFTSYASGGFTETDLRLLSGVAKLLSRKKGCKVMITHSDCPLVHDVFGWMDKHPVLAEHSVSQSGSSRGDVAELVFTSY